MDYEATKGAIFGFTHSLAAQLMRKGIRVNSVAWVIEEYGRDDKLIDLNSPGNMYRTISKTPEIELWGSNRIILQYVEPSELAMSFVFLASKKASLYCEFCCVWSFLSHWRVI